MEHTRKNILETFKLGSPRTVILIVVGNRHGVVVAIEKGAFG